MKNLTLFYTIKGLITVIAKSYLLFFIFLLLLPGCAGVTALLETEIATLARFGLRMEASGAIAVESEALFADAVMKRMAISRTFGRTVFTASFEGISASFELTGSTVMRRVGGSGVVNLAGRLAQLTGRGRTTITIKASPEALAKAVKTLYDGRPVLIMDETKSGWSKVRYDEKAPDGWVETNYLEELYKTPEQILDEYSKDRKTREPLNAPCNTGKGNVVILIQNSSKWTYVDNNPISNHFTIRIPKFPSANADSDFYYTSFYTNQPVTLFDIPEGTYSYEVKRFYGGSGSYQGWFRNEITIGGGTVRVFACHDNQITLQK